MNEDIHALDRRAFLRRAGMFGAVAVTAPSLVALVGCSKPNFRKSERDDSVYSCDGTKILTGEEQQLRRDNNYTEKAPNGDKSACMSCQYYVQGGDGDDCGGCGVIPGPINPHGRCDQWQPA